MPRKTRPPAGEKNWPRPRFNEAAARCRGKLETAGMVYRWIMLQ